MYRHKFAHFCGCLQEHFVLHKLGQELSIHIKQKMTDYIKKPHTTIFTSQNGCGKTHLVLKLIEKEYNKHFDFIVIICPTLRENSTYNAKD